MCQVRCQVWSGMLLLTLPHTQPIDMSRQASPWPSLGPIPHSLRSSARDGSRGRKNFAPLWLGQQGAAFPWDSPFLVRSGLVQVPRTTPCFGLSLSGGLSPLLTSGNCHRRAGSQQGNLPIASLCSGVCTAGPSSSLFPLRGGSQEAAFESGSENPGEKQGGPSDCYRRPCEGLQQQRRSARRRGQGLLGSASSQSVLGSSAFSLLWVFPPSGLSRKVTPHSITVTVRLDRAPPAPQFGYSRDSV